MNGGPGSRPEYPILLSAGGALTVLLVTLTAMAGATVFAWRFDRFQKTPQVLSLAIGSGGFSPSELVVDPRRPVTFRILRHGDDPCTSGVVLEGTALRREIPANGETDVEWVPGPASDYDLHCEMGCLHAKVKLVAPSGFPWAIVD